MLKQTTIKVREATEELVKKTRKLTSKLVGMLYSEESLGYLDDDQAEILRDCNNLMEACYDYSYLQAGMLDQMNERLEAIQQTLEELKKQAAKEK